MVRTACFQSTCGSDLAAYTAANSETFTQRCDRFTLRGGRLHVASGRSGLLANINNLSDDMSVMRDRKMTRGGRRITVADGDDSAVYRRRLRTELRSLRLAADKTQKDVAEALEWSPSKMLRIESGASNIGTTDLRALLAYYRVTDEEVVENYLNMGRAARQRTWRDEHRPHIDQQFFAFLEYEASAVRIRQFQSTVVPGLLQTEEYMRSLFASFYSDQQALERVVDIRLKRQQIISQPDGPGMVFLLDESVLRHLVGTSEVMIQQAERILELATNHSNITVRVVPFDAGIHFGMRGSFSLLDLSEDADERVVVLEEPTRDVLIRDDPAEIDRYSNGFAEIEARSLSEEDSLRLIGEIRNPNHPSER